jgi:hypothetical protein
MKGVFYAMGPRIPAGTRTGTVHATEIHALMMNVLGLPTAASASRPDGTLTKLLLPERR